MLRGSMLLLLLLFAAAPPAAAQAAGAGGAMNATERAGEMLFRQHCGVCHLKPLIVSGQFGPVLSREAVDGKEAAVHALIAAGTTRMPGFRYEFDGAQIDSIIAYLKTVPAPATAAGGTKRPGAAGAMGAD